MVTASCMCFLTVLELIYVHLINAIGMLLTFSFIESWVQCTVNNTRSLYKKVAPAFRHRWSELQLQTSSSGYR